MGGSFFQIYHSGFVWGDLEIGIGIILDDGFPQISCNKLLSTNSEIADIFSKTVM